MNSVKALSELVMFLKNNVASKIKLQRDTQDDIYCYELINPSVFPGWIPPNGYLPDGCISTIPCIIAGLEGGGDDGELGEEDVKLSFAVYSPGTHLEDGSYTPDFRGYTDLLNLMELTKAELIKAGPFGISKK